MKTTQFLLGGISDLQDNVRERDLADERVPQTLGPAADRDDLGVLPPLAAFWAGDGSGRAAIQVG